MLPHLAPSVQSLLQPPKAASKHHTQGTHRALEIAGGEPSLAITCATSAAVDLETSAVFCSAMFYNTDLFRDFI